MKDIDAGVRVTVWFAPPDKQPEEGNLTLRSVHSSVPTAASWTC